MVQLQTIKFFKEFVSICKVNNGMTVSFFKYPPFFRCMSPVTVGVYRSNALFELIKFIQRILSNYDSENKAANIAAEVLLCLVQIESSKIQNWIKENDSGLPLQDQILTAIIDRLQGDQNYGIRMHLASIVRTLLDPPNLVGPVSRGFSVNAGLTLVFVECIRCATIRSFQRLFLCSTSESTLFTLFSG